MIACALAGQLAGKPMLPNVTKNFRIVSTLMGSLSVGAGEWYETQGADLSILHAKRGGLQVRDESTKVSKLVTEAPGVLLARSAHQATIAQTMHYAQVMVPVMCLTVRHFNPRFAVNVPFQLGLPVLDTGREVQVLFSSGTRVARTTWFFLGMWLVSRQRPGTVFWGPVLDQLSFLTGALRGLGVLRKPGLLLEKPVSPPRLRLLRVVPGLRFYLQQATRESWSALALACLLRSRCDRY